MAWCNIGQHGFQLNQSLAMVRTTTQYSTFHPCQMLVRIKWICLHGKLEQTLRLSETEAYDMKAWLLVLLLLLQYKYNKSMFSFQFHDDDTEIADLQPSTSTIISRRYYVWHKDWFIFFCWVLYGRCPSWENLGSIWWANPDKIDDKKLVTRGT